VRVPLKSPVRENRTPGSVRGPQGNRRSYLDGDFAHRLADEHQLHDPEATSPHHRCPWHCARSSMVVHQYRYRVSLYCVSPRLAFLSPIFQRRRHRIVSVSRASSSHFTLHPRWGRFDHLRQYFHSKRPLTNIQRCTSKCIQRRLTRAVQRTATAVTRAAPRRACRAARAPASAVADLESVRATPHASSTNGR